MFPDSKIASGYSVHSDKTRYIIVYGLTPFVKGFIINDTKNKCFSYKFYETATPKIEEQYDGYITYFSNFFKQVITVYSGFIFVGHCKAKTFYITFIHSWILRVYLRHGLLTSVWMAQR